MATSCQTKTCLQLRLNSGRPTMLNLVSRIYYFFIYIFFMHLFETILNRLIDLHVFFLCCCFFLQK